MDVQSAMPPAASAPSASVVGVPPQIGTPVPGSSGGLPALQGLSVTQNPMAEQLRSQGRGDDTMLVHMTPNEVNSLQGLALATGGSLTINPETGLPEAGWLGKLLPTILGAVGMAFGIPPVWMGAAGAVGGTIATGDLGKGLSMGLQAYGGASMAGGLGLGGKLGHVGQSLGLPGSNAIGGAAAKQVAQQATQRAVPAAVQNAASNITTPLNSIDYGGLSKLATMAPSATGAVPAAVTAASDALAAAQPLSSIAPSTIAAGVPPINTGPTGFFGKFAEASRAGLPGGVIGKAAPMLAAQGVMSGLSGAMTPSSGGYTTSDGKIDNSYQGPYYSPPRKATFAPTTEELLSSTKERRYFDVDMPEVYNVQGQLVQPGSSTAKGTPILQSVLNPNAKKGEPMYSFRQVPYMMSPEEQQMAQMYPGIYGGMGYAEGGEVQIADGGFVVDARTVSELGNGSSGAGQELLAKMGGRPIQGPGDGVSDSIPARIGRDQPARVARDEVIFDPAAVRRIGKGDEKRGAQKLYAMMDKAHAARKRAGRGSDTKLRKGLA